MSVDFRDNAVAHIPESVHLKSEDFVYTFKNVQLSLASNFLERKTGPDVEYSNNSKIENYTAVILGFFDGHFFVEDQLKSIFNQTHKSHHIFVCDDKSTQPLVPDSLYIDDEQRSRLSFSFRPHNIGFTNNFLNALASVCDDFEYFAFSDQDDVWHEDKLEKAINALKGGAVDVPALYCAATQITDATCQQTLGFSPLFNKRPSFSNALVQNIGGGNTMVFNKAAKELIVNTTRDTNVVSHDWWCYQIVTGAGGHVVYDPAPCLKYRQHAHNLVGANTSWRARLVRIRELLQGHFRIRNDINLTALAEQKHLLTAANQRVLNDFIEARQSSLPKRLMLFKRSGIYRQTLFGNLGLLLGVFLNKV